MNSKGANVIFTSIMIILLSVAAMIIIIGLVVPFFTSLKEEINFNHNKENLLLINNELVELKNFDINTFKNLNIYVVDEIVFDATTNTVYIKQKISNNSFKNFKDTNIGNLTIVKGNGLMTFTLDLDGIVTLDETTIINNNFTLKATIVDIVNDVPVISITQYLGQVYLTISPKLNTFISSLEITLTSTPTNANIYYTTDGTEPTESSTLYTAPFTITDSTTIKARGYSNHYTSSPIISKKYFGVLIIDSLDITPNDGVFVISRIVTATSVPEDTNIYYTTDGNDPDENSTLYSGPLTITEGGTYKFKAFKTKYNPSEIITRIFTEITGVSFYNQYDQNTTTTDISDKNNVIINHNISFDDNGAYFDNNSDHYIFIENDWNGSNTSLNLGVSNFTLEAFVSDGYNGEILSKRGYIGGLDLKIDENSKVTLVFSGYDQIYSPQYMASDENYLYIADTGNHRIQKRKKENWELVLITGGPLATSAIDGFNNPAGIAVDDNFVYVTDASNHRMVKLYKDDFSYHSMISAGSGTAANQISTPAGIAVDDNYLYIVETTYHRLKIYDKNSFDLITTIGGTSAGSGDTQFSSPRGVTVDDNYIYVTESGYHRIKKFNKSTYAFVSKAGGPTSGYGDNQFYNPSGISVDDNYIYIADYYPNRIIIRNKDLNMTYYSKITGSGATYSSTYFYYPMGITNDENHIYITENGNHKIRKIKQSDYSTEDIFSYMSGEDLNYSEWSPAGIDSDENYIYYIDSGFHRLVKKRISDMTTVGIVGGPYPGTTDTTFYNPTDLDVDENYIYVTDMSNHKIKKFNKDTLEWIYSCYLGTSVMPSPNHIVVDGNTLYVTTNSGSTRDALLKISMTDNSCELLASIGGAEGTGDEQFKDPEGITIDENYVYVSDYYNYRVKKHLKSDLSYVSQLGSTGKYGFYPDTLFYLYDVEYYDNHIYVVLPYTGEIRKYTTDFNYVSAIGFVKGYATDEFYNPYGITISNGYMYITDTTLGRITKRSLDEFEVDINFTGNGLDFNFFYGPYSIDSDENYYYIVNYGLSRLEKRRKTDLVRVGYFGGPTNKPYYTTDGLHYPTSVVIDENYVYVSDGSNHRVVKLNKEDLSYSANFGTTGTSGSGETRLYGPKQIAINDSNLYIADYSNNRIVVLNKADMTYITAYGTTGSGNDNFSGIWGIAVDDNYIYTSELLNYRIKKLNISDFSFVTSIGSYGTGDTQFYEPHEISIDENYIYVADYRNNRIKKHLKSDLNFVSKIGSSGTGNDNFMLPTGIRYKDENTLFVTENSINNRIHVRNPSDLSFNSMIDLSPFNNDGLYLPYGIDIDDNYLYVADYGHHRIIKKNKSDLSLVASLGGPLLGSGNNSFNQPFDLAVDDDYIYVTDWTYNQIKQYNKSDLSWVYNYAPGTGTLRYPFSIAVDGNDVYIIEKDYHRIKKFDKSNTPWTLVATIGGTSAGSGNDEFSSPRGITIYGDYIYVADTGNHRIHKRNKSDLNYVEIFGVGVAGVGASDLFNSPYAVYVHNDIIYVANNPTSNDKITVLDLNFNFLYKFGNTYWGQDQFSSVTDLAVDDNYIYMPDYIFSRIGKRSLTELENIRNIPKTNYTGIKTRIASIIASTGTVSGDSQIAIKRSGNNFCIYINGIQDVCENIDYNIPTYLTFPEINNRYGSSATSTTHYLSENQNYYPWGIGSYGLTTPGSGHIKYLRVFDTNLSDSDINALYQSYK